MHIAAQPRSYDGRVRCLLVLALLAAPAHAGTLDVASFRLQAGDDPRWAAPDFDDHAWPLTTLHDVTAAGGPLWLRATVELAPSREPRGVLFAGLASHELYWDGAPIGAGGVVGHDAASEVAGPIVMRHWIPGDPAPGRHTLALRLSAFHRNVPVAQPLWLVLVGSYDRLGETPPLYVWIAISSCSGLVLGAVFALCMYFAHRRDPTFLYLCALCATGVALLGAESWRPLLGYTYDWHGPRLVLVSLLTWLLNALIVRFTVVRLPGRGARAWQVAALVAMAAAWLAPGWDAKAWLMFLVGLGAAFAWTVRALRARRGGRMMAAVFAVSLLVLLAAPEHFANLSVFLLLDFLLLCLVVPYAIARGWERRHRDRALLTAARLEAELVRKHLQPHFLMNTLTALGEWIDQDPRVAGEMIEALADELRLLHDICDRPLITMAEELRLCRAHLSIMSRRKDRTYELTAHGVDPRAAIPPAVVHTLVENAITHGGTTPLTLTATTDGDRTRYVFEAPLGEAAVGAPREGAGTRYIRARLQESFGTRWTFTAGAVGGVWRTEIELPA